MVLPRVRWRGAGGVNSCGWRRGAGGARLGLRCKPARLLDASSCVGQNHSCCYGVVGGFVDQNEGAGSLVAGGKKYMLNANGNFYLPNPTGLARGDSVVLEATRAAVPVVNTHASTTKINTARGEATSILVDVPGEEVRLIWNNFEWVL